MSTDTTRRVIELLLPVLDDLGVEGWLKRPRHQLGDRSPQDLLAEGEDDAVLAMALALRSQRLIGTRSDVRPESAAVSRGLVRPLGALGRCHTTRRAAHRGRAGEQDVLDTHLGQRLD